MDMEKGFLLVFQIVAAILTALSSVTVVLSYFNIKSKNLPPFLQSLLITPWYYYVITLLILIVI
jgi:hypothetical protein